MTSISSVDGNRPTALTPARLAVVSALFALLLLAVLALAEGRPGDPLPQLAGALGTALLLAPAAFSVHKRAGGATRPRAWFVAHVLASLLGALCIAVHLRGGSLLSPPGAVAAALFFLIVQGLLARARLGRDYARLFARAPRSFAPVDADRSALATLIERKRALLAVLDPAADEGLFSLQWRHWLASPSLSWRYAGLVRRERALVQAKLPVGTVLRGWRGLHIACACVFFVGLLAHMVVVLFFAGYAAGGEAPYWWHLFAWGAGR